MKDEIKEDEVLKPHALPDHERLQRECRGYTRFAN
jgi:hypothetical protein